MQLKIKSVNNEGFLVTSDNQDIGIDSKNKESKEDTFKKLKNSIYDNI